MKTIRLIHIVSASENNCIGNDGKLPWHLSADLKKFKALTTGNVLLMGRKTFDSIGKPLPNRFSFVISRSKSDKGAGYKFVKSIDEGITEAAERARSDGKDVFIIGGGEIYAQTLDLVDEIYLTRVHQHVLGDAHYPVIDEMKWRCMETEEHREENPSYSFYHYKRV